MALILLIVIGASIGWLSSVLARTDEPGAIMRQVAVGLAASLLVGLLANSGTILGGLTALALGAAVVASAAALGGYHYYLSRNVDA